MSSHVVNKQKNYNQQNNISRVQHQSLNPRGPAPENHQRQEHRTLSYSSVAAPRQGISQPTHQTHDSVIGKSHPSANTVQQVVLTQQSNLQSQVANVNPAGPQMNASGVGNSGANMPVMQSNVSQLPQSGPRFAQTQYHPRQQHRALLPTQNTHRTQNTVPTSGVAQAVPQSVGPHNMAHSGGHPHYFLMPSQPQQHQYQQLQNQLHLNQQHLTHSYGQHGRPLQAGMPQYYAMPFAAQQQTPYSQPTFQTYMYPQHYTHPQPNPQMMSNQMHQNRGAQVSAPPVIQAPQPMPVQMTAPNNDVSESTPIQPQKPIQKRARTLAVITDPNSGKNLNIEELAKEEPKNQPPVTRSNETLHTGASNLPNASIASSPNDAESIAIQFATNVARVATQPIPGPPTSATVNEDTVSVDSNVTPIVVNLETDESVAINSKTPLSELMSETNVKNSDICDQSTDESNNLVIKSNLISASNSSFDNKTDDKLLNNISAQNSNEIYSQLSVEKSSVQTTPEITENGDLNELNDDSIEAKEEMDSEIAKDLSIQKVNNNNNRKKETNKRVENVIKLEINDNKVDIGSDVTDNVVTVIETVIETIGPKDTTDPSSPVMITSLSNDSIKSETICNNICENDLQTKDIENNRINELQTKEVFAEQNEVQIESAIPSTPTILPDLPYKDDQWTPLNPDGKKHYDRNFLLAVRDKSESSLKMPDSLNEVRNQEIIRKESSSSGHTGEDPTNYFMPQFASKQPSSFGNRLMPQISRRQSQPGGRHQEKTRKIISTSLTHDVKLHTTENAWKPTKMAPTVIDPEEQETLDLLKRIRGILNKLTPQKYDSLVNQIMSFKIDTEDRLKRVLDLVFEKAVDEPAFCLQYANLCKHLSSFKVVINKEDNNVEEVKFHKLLLSKCQKEFEADIYVSITDLNERKEEINNCLDPQKKKTMTEILDEDMRRARKRSLGNIKLIGELYKLNMLKANIMVQCVENLIRESDDESLECLCALLRTIGEQIEAEAKNMPKQLQLIESFFVRMDNIAELRDPDVKDTSPRVRFMLRDVIDMRDNNWKARRDENLPKMIDEIHKEAQKEDEQTLRDIQQHSFNRKQEERDRKQKGGRMANDSSDGNPWQTVSGRKSQTQAQQPNIDWQKLRHNFQQQNHDTVQLGPQTGTWGLGSRGGAQSSQSKFSADDKQINRFSALEANDGRKSSQKSNIPSRDSSKGRSNQQSGRGGRSQGGSRVSDREDAINLARSFTTQRHSPSESSQMYGNVYSRNSSRSGSREASAPNSRNNSMRRETPELEITSPLKGLNISSDELQTKCLTSINEYLNVKSVEDPELEVPKLCNDSNVDIYISTAINRVLESSSHSDHFDIGKLIIHLISKHVIRLQHFYKGLSSVLELASDIEIDVPKLWNYISEVLAPIFVNFTENRKKLILEVIKYCEPNKRAKFVAKIFRAVADFTTDSKANELWLNSELNWKDFLDSNENIETFVKQNNVEFTTKLTNNKSINYGMFGKEVESLVRQKKSNDEIQSFISKHFNASQTSDHRFTSALFSGVLRACINAPNDPKETHSFTLDTQTLITTSPLLVKFFGGDPELELQALIILQELMEQLEHPPNLLYKIFQDLYDQSVISHDAFLQWEKSDNTSAGKAVAVASVVRFLTWLRENEDDDEDETEGIGS